MKTRSNTAWIGIPSLRLDASKSAEAKAKKQAFFDKMADEDDDPEEEEEAPDMKKKTKKKGGESFFERMEAVKAAKAGK